MRRRLRAVPLMLALSTLGIVSQAQIPPSQSVTQTIVTLSFNNAVLQTAEAQKALAGLQSRFAPRQAQLQALSDEVDALRKQVSGAADKLNDTERETRQQSLDRKERQLQRQAEDFKNDSQSESQQIFQKVAQKLYVFLQAYSQQHSYSAVLERGSDAAPVVWYAAAKLDITDQLVKAYNAQPSADSSGNSDSPNRGSSTKPPKTLPESPSPHP
jgi:outer membrane protein